MVVRGWTTFPPQACAKKIPKWHKDHELLFQSKGIAFDPNQSDGQRYEYGANRYYEHLSSREKSVLFYFDETQPAGADLETITVYPWLH
jgi:hypothetical protein